MNESIFIDELTDKRAKTRLISKSLRINEKMIIGSEIKIMSIQEICICC